MSLDAILIRNFAIALFIGALVGIEREKKKASEPSNGIGGLRTFILFAEAGAVAAWLSTATGSGYVFVGIGALVTAVVIAGYWANERAHPGQHGLTTEVAALVVYLLGGATLFGHPEIAVALAIVTSALLAFKQPLHGAVGKLGTDDIYAGLTLLIATFIVLPLLPDRPIDPWGALNPYKLWWLVILISGLSLVGYVAVRWLGPQRGTSLTGFFGGLVSSTAVTLSFARRSREEPALAAAIATGLLLAWGTMSGRVIVEVAIVNRGLLRGVAVPIVAMGVVGLAAAAWFYYRAGAGHRARAKAEADAARNVPLTNPFSLYSAVKFGLFFAAVLLVVKLVQDYAAGAAGFYAVSALAGATDVDAITLSMATYAKNGGSPEIAVTSIVIAALANTAVKAGMVLVLGASVLRGRIAAAAGGILAAGAIALLVL